MLSSTALVACAVPSRPPRSARAQAPVECALHRRFYSRRLAFQAEPVPQHERRREEHRQRVGDPLPGDVRRRAVHRLEHARARRPPSEALGSIPIEPVSIAASSERMSPNRFSVRITSKCRGRGDELHRRVVDEHVLRARCWGTPRECTRVTISRHRRLVSSTLALSTLDDTASARRERRSGRSARSPRRCRGRGRWRDRRCASSRRSRCRR